LTCESNTVYNIHDVKTKEVAVAFVSQCFHR